MSYAEKEGLISPLAYSIKDDAEMKALVDVGPGNYVTPLWVSHPTLVTEAVAAGGCIGLDYVHVNTLADETGNRSSISYGNLWENWEHEVPEERIFDLVFDADENEVINEYKKIYKQFVLDSRAQFVTGVLDPNDDAAWNKYLDELKKNGEDDLLDAVQSAYTRMFG